MKNQPIFDLSNFDVEVSADVNKFAVVNVPAEKIVRGLGTRIINLKICLDKCSGEAPSKHITAGSFLLRLVIDDPSFAGLDDDFDERSLL